MADAGAPRYGKTRACLTEGAVGHDLSVIPDGKTKALSIEHPTGEMTVIGHLEDDGTVGRTEVLRTARKLFDGTVFPRSAGKEAA